MFETVCPFEFCMFEEDEFETDYFYIVMTYGMHHGGCAARNAELLEKGGIYRSVFDKQQLEKQLQADRADLPGSVLPGGDPA